MNHIDVKKRKCLICGVRYKKIYGVIRHVGISHNKVAELLPRETQTPKKMINFDRDYQCHLCLSLHRNRDKLYRHYSSAHFKNELMPHVDTENVKCKICDKKLIGINETIRHVGAVHEEVEQYLPEQHHVAKVLTETETETRSERGKDRSTDGSADQTNEMKSCSLCSFSTKGRCKLYEHYSKVLYKDQMRI